MRKSLTWLNQTIGTIRGLNKSHDQRGISLMEPVLVYDAFAYDSKLLRALGRWFDDLFRKSFG